MLAERAALAHAQKDRRGGVVLYASARWIRASDSLLPKLFRVG
jgi:hypothetical protein